MLNSSLEFVDKKTRTQRNLRSILDEEVPVEIEKSMEPVYESKISVEEVTDKVEEPRGFMVPDESLSEIPNISDNELNNKVPSSEKLRVVEVIPISDSVTEKDDEQDFIVSDFQDDDYVDFESAIQQVEDN